MCVQSLSCVLLFVTHGLQPTRLLCPWDFPDKNTGVACHFLLQGIFPTQGSNLCFLSLLHWQADSLPLSHPGTQFRMYPMLNILSLLKLSFVTLPFPYFLASDSLFSWLTLCTRSLSWRKCLLPVSFSGTAALLSISLILTASLP